MSIILGPPVIESNDERITYRVETNGFPGPDSLWFSVPVEAASLLNPRGDAAIVALLMPLMSLGRRVTVEGPFTDELAWNVRGEVQQILRRLRPELAPVEIDFDDLVPPLPPGTAVGTGYSAGVDSYTTLARFLFAADVPAGMRVTHLLYNNVGSHGHGETGRTRYENRLNLLRPHARSTGLPLIDVDSNLDDFFLATGIAFQPSHTIRNSAVVHLLSAGIRQYLYSSAVSYDDVTCTPTFDISHADPILLPFLSTRSTTLQSSGSDLDRKAKIALVAEMPLTYERLDVCVASRDGTNCSECRKCQRTMLFLELLGALDRYGKVFTTPRNPRWREEHIIQSIIQGVPSARSIVRLYDAQVGVPLRLRAEARRRITVRETNRVVGSVKRRFARAMGS